MADFCSNLFFRGLPANSDNYASMWFWNSLLMLLACLAVVYLITLLLLSFTPLYRSPETQPLIDVDSRIQLCLTWALVVVFLLLSGVVFWLWYRGELVPEGEIWARARIITAHWTVMVVLFVVWLLLYLSGRRDIKRLQKGVPKV